MLIAGFIGWVNKDFAESPAGFPPGAEVFAGNISVPAEENADGPRQPTKEQHEANRVEHSSRFAWESGESTKNETPQIKLL